MKKYQVMYYAGAAISLLVGLWHFTVPWMFGWASYIPYETLVVSAILLKQLGFSDSVIIYKHSYHSPKRGEYKKGFGCTFPNRGESAKRFYRRSGYIETKYRIKPGGI